MQAVVIGAGIVGLHVARALRQKGHDVFVLEQEQFLAEHTSGRNSGVCHAGIFYPTGSHKETICIEGNRLTYEWLQRLKVEHRPSGKWIVPESGQEDQLEPFYERIRKLPIPAPLLKEPAEVAAEEPQLRPTRAILIPSTGILDAGEYVKALARYVQERGVMIVMNCRVSAITDQVLKTTRDEIPFDYAINCAGLFSDEIALQAGITNYTIKPCRGDYYVFNKPVVRRPVYHLPYQGAQGLGVHLTPTLDGQTLIGPNAYFIEGKTDYDPHSAPEVFLKSLQFYIPHLKDPKIIQAYTGNRPKLFVDGKPCSEFKIIRNGKWTHLLGIESPGLTSAPVLAREVVEGI